MKLLGVALLLALACLSDVAHTAGNEPDGCAQVKLEGPRALDSFVDAAVLPTRFEPGEPAMLTRVVRARTSTAASCVFTKRAGPRAPPIA